MSDQVTPPTNAIDVVTDFKPVGPVASIEVQPVKDHGDGYEQCAVGEENFWSVYVRYDANRCAGFGGVDCIANSATRESAVTLAKLMGALLKVEVVTP